MKQHRYHLTPLPASARTPVGWVALCFAALIFSPFVGFAIHGKVEEPGLVIGLKFAVLPLIGLTVIALRRHMAMRRLPPELLREWKQGKLVPAEDAPRVVPPLRFTDGKRWILTAADAVSDSDGISVRWADIVEWSVEQESDGPDYHLLRTRSGGAIRLRRIWPKQAAESDILDAVRSVGRVPIRLRSAIYES